MFKLVQNTAKNVIPIIIQSRVLNVNQFKSTQCSRLICTTQPILEKKEVQVTFVRADGEKIHVAGKVGESLLDVVNNNDIDIDGFGACDGTLTCSTCHLILKKEDYDALPTTPNIEEKDMLDLASDLTDTSRLGCQVILTEDMKNLEVVVPATLSDAR